MIGCLVTATMLSFFSTCATAANLIDPRCESMIEPLGIDTLKPRLSWVMQSHDQGLQVRGEHQTAYQVLVASSEKLLNEDQGDLWDSGKVLSDQSIHIDYAGLPLISKQRCYWKVRVWDRKKNPTELRCAFSLWHSCTVLALKYRRAVLAIYPFVSVRKKDRVLLHFVGNSSTSPIYKFFFSHSLV